MKEVGVGAGTLIVVSFLFFAAAGSASAEPRAPAASDSDYGFRGFCNRWMKKLEGRERSNRSRISWSPVGGLVRGEYVGYGDLDQCRVTRRAGEQPVGRITYHELTYQVQGLSPREATKNAARVVIDTEVTEIFRFSRGRWRY